MSIKNQSARQKNNQKTLENGPRLLVHTLCFNLGISSRFSCVKRVGRGVGKVTCSDYITAKSRHIFWKDGLKHVKTCPSIKRNFIFFPPYYSTKKTKFHKLKPGIQRLTSNEHFLGCNLLLLCFVVKEYLRQNVDLKVMWPLNVSDWCLTVPVCSLFNPTMETKLNQAWMRKDVLRTRTTQPSSTKIVQYNVFKRNRSMERS